MARIDAAVFDTGPPLHLHEVRTLNAVRVVKKRILTPEVTRELSERQVPLAAFVTASLAPRSKDVSRVLTERDGMHLGEAESIACALDMHLRYFFTDDLEAREVAKRHGLQAHGTLGLITRALREGVVTRTAATKAVNALRAESSLFITSDLTKWALREIERFAKA